MENKTHYKKLRNPNYIGSYELTQNNNKTISLNVTIEKTVKEPVQNGDKKEDMMVMYLKNQKPMIVNSTNAKMISKVIGSPFIEDWTGKTITLYVANIRAFGEMQQALRVRDKLPTVSLPDFNPTNKHWTATVDALKAKKTTISKLREKVSITSENEAKLITESK